MEINANWRMIRWKMWKRTAEKNLVKIKKKTGGGGGEEGEVLVT